MDWVALRFCGRLDFFNFRRQPMNERPMHLHCSRCWHAASKAEHISSDVHYDGHDTVCMVATEVLESFPYVARAPKMTDMKITDHQNCSAGNRKTWAAGLGG